MTPQEFGDFLKISFPPLRNAGYDLAYATQNTLFPFQEEINTPALIKQYLIKASRSLSIFVRPRVDLSSVCIQVRICSYFAYLLLLFGFFYFFLSTS